MKGCEEGAPPCASCHAENGAADGSGAFPRLTGQFAFYLNKQLEDFAAGTRDNPVMTPIAKRLSSQEKRDVTRHNDEGGVMRRIAGKLPEGQQRAMSVYFASVRPACSCDEATANHKAEE